MSLRLVISPCNPPSTTLKQRDREAPAGPSKHSALLPWARTGMVDSRVHLILFPRVISGPFEAKPRGCKLQGTGQKRSVTCWLVWGQQVQRTVPHHSPSGTRRRLPHIHLASDRFKSLPNQVRSMKKKSLKNLDSKIEGENKIFEDAFYWICTDTRVIRI